jgi:hypothetical protein
MSSTMETPTWTDHDWRIVRADLDLSHVFLPNNRIRFEAGEENGLPGFRLLQLDAGPTAGSFGKPFLVSVQGHQPRFNTVADQEELLPPFELANATELKTVAERIGKYMLVNPQVQRLQGKITISCHDTPAQLANSRAPKHDPLPIETPIHVYLFAKAVKGGKPLLVIHTPLSPTCPLNGNGTVLAYD